MQHNLDRFKIPGVITANKPGCRPSRGVRRHNRKLIAEARRAHKSPVPRKEEKPSTATSLDPWVYDYEVARLAKNERGDCPSCGQYGAHTLKPFRKFPEGTSVKLRQCSNCGSKFSNLPKKLVAEPPKGPRYEDLPDSKETRYNDCPSCEDIYVRAYLLVPDGDGRRVAACKCKNGHVFKKGVNAPEPSVPWTSP